MGRLYYLPTALEARSKYLRAVVNERADFDSESNKQKSLARRYHADRRESNPLRTCVRLKC